MSPVSDNAWGMEGYGPASYGDAFADVYDEWYGGLGDGDLVFCGWNTLLNLPDDAAVCRTFALVAGVLAPGGSFVVDASLPFDDGAGDDVSVRTITADRVVLSVSTHDPATRRIRGQFVEFANGAAPVLRPWSVRYVPVAELDRFAEVAGLTLVSRTADGNGAQFTQESTRHVSVWRRT